MKKTLNLFIALSFVGFLFGQEPVYLTNGDLSAQFTSNGATTPSNGAFLELEKEGQKLSLMYEVGLFVSGFDPAGNLKTYTTRGTEVESGIIGVDATITMPWRVTSDQVAAHLADFMDNGTIDDPIPAIYAWPGNGNPDFEEYNGYSLGLDSGVAVGQFWDGNLNGIYEPSQGEYPAYFTQGCGSSLVVPTEMLLYPFALSAVGSDNFESVQVYLTAFRFGCTEEEGTLNNSLFLSYRVALFPLEFGAEPLDSTYIGFFIDGDIGCYADDYVGTFPLRNSVYFYNADPSDSNCDPIEGFGANPAVVGIDLLRGPLSDTGIELGLTSVMPLTNASVSPGQPLATTDYTNPVSLRNYLMGQWLDGQPLLDEGFGYGSGNPASLAFSGDPVQGTGWTEIGENNTPGDRRAIMSSGPFVYELGAINEYLLSFTFNYDPSSGHLAQINGLRDRIDVLQSFFDNCFDTGSLSPGDGCTLLVTEVETPLEQTNNQLGIYPNPTQTEVTIKFPALEQGMLSVYTADGRLLLQKRINSDITTLDCSQWPSGLYLLRWEGEHQVLAQKLLVD
jgi:hypothetical protein